MDSVDAFGGLVQCILLTVGLGIFFAQNCDKFKAASSPSFQEAILILQRVHLTKKVLLQRWTLKHASSYTLVFLHSKSLLFVT